MPKATQLSESPRPVTQHERILLGHGSGGKLMHELIEDFFRPLLLDVDSPVLNDSSLFQVNGAKMAITVDSFVVSPIFFPGGDIGRLAVNGTVNDLAVSGAIPLLLSAAFILEEGLSTEDLHRIVVSMKEAADQAGVSIVTGDTKVVDRGKGDKIFVNTTGIGVLEQDLNISADQAQPGDLVLLNGPIASHGIAVLLAREELEFERPVESDTAPLNSLVRDMLKATTKIHCMRDLTRGGLASSLNEIASGSSIGIRIREESIPIQDEVRGACEMLGLEPLQVANEGKLVAIVAREEGKKLLERMKRNPQGGEAALIGEVVEDHPGKVVMKTQIGGFRVVEMLAGEQLPRIC
jgi:hydrogenase expression/formation protein HypE